jgi:hypothetical protein
MYLSDSIFGRLGDLLDKALCNGGLVFLQDSCRLMEQLRSLPQWGPSPCLLCRLCCLHNLVHLFLCACYNPSHRKEGEKKRADSKLTLNISVFNKNSPQLVDRNKLREEKLFKSKKLETAALSLKNVKCVFNY